MMFTYFIYLPYPSSKSLCVVSPDQMRSRLYKCKVTALETRLKSRLGAIKQEYGFSTSSKERRKEGGSGCDGFALNSRAG